MEQPEHLVYFKKNTGGKTRTLTVLKVFAFSNFMQSTNMPYIRELKLATSFVAETKLEMKNQVPNPKNLPL